MLAACDDRYIDLSPTDDAGVPSVDAPFEQSVDARVDAPGFDADGGACPAASTLPPIPGGDAVPFRLCFQDGDCETSLGHLCYHAPGKVGFCHVADADDTCDGEGDVNLQAVPGLPEWGEGICVFTEWRDYLCCIAPSDWDC